MASGQYTVLSDQDRLMKESIDSDIRMQSMNMSQFRTIGRTIPSFGKNKGSTVEIEKWQKLTKATSELSELRSLPIQRNSINSVDVTVKEYGNGVGSTHRARTLAEYSVDEQLKKLLAMNQTESMDQIAGTEFQTSDVFYTPTSASAGTLDKDGTPSTNAGASLTSAHIRDIVTNMKNDNVPRWDGKNYLAVLNVFTMERVFEDTAAGSVVDLHKYEQPQAMLAGELGQYFGCRMVEENNVLSSTIGGSAHIGEGIFIGFDPVVEALVEPEHFEIEEFDFGRFHSVAWLALTGFKKVWTNSTDGEYRLVRIHDNQ